ncbi:hypothetical protein MIND_01138800 [Mycena indigotica]|uniref:Uncharacterized protein n=1 Tax=Mycena indigotica TaxID=2126181 RepID=A0A8H6VTQ6_9AGAR|nr:uncharacterized protein MIND_01138800 [Mycena indigotica]KAF7293597.1 hypothetical protein MIND_01138800 [Mycena indigotica]
MLLADSDADGEEHVNACWAIVVLDRAWSVVMNTLPNWTNPIETPWPGTKVSGMTDIVQTFLAVGDHQPPKSSKELLAKAAVLWEAANHLVTRSEWKPGSPHNVEAAQAFYDRFSAIDKRIEEICSPPNPSSQSDPSSMDQQNDLVGRSMAHAAEIQLHRPFAHQEDNQLTQERSQQRFLDAARAILHLALKELTMLTGKRTTTRKWDHTQLVSMAHLPSASGKHQSGSVHLRTVHVEHDVVDHAQGLREALDKDKAAVADWACEQSIDGEVEGLFSVCLNRLAGTALLVSKRRRLSAKLGAMDSLALLNDI